MSKVLVVDDKRASRMTVAMTLRRQGHEVDECSCVSEALETISKDAYDLIITDMRMPVKPGMTEDPSGGLKVIDAVKSAYENPAIIVMTAYASIDNALEAVRLGATDYLIKEFSKAELEIKAAMALEQRRIKIENSRLLRENLQLRDQVRDKYQFGSIIGQSNAMQQVFEKIRVAARNPDNVLIQGENGTGKELVARAIHYNSPRSKARLITLNCAAIPREIIESELFGHKRGAFTGAVANRIGAFEEANGGTILLDEIGDMPLEMQSRLLRVIEQKEVKPIGSSITRTMDVRIIAATNKDLSNSIAQGTFREDLFYRLNVIPITLPSLRDRKEDIPVLANHFVSRFISERDTVVRGISPEALRVLEGYQWPGNVRELEHVLLRVIISIQEPVIEPRHLPGHIQSPERTPGDKEQDLGILQDRLISELPLPTSRTEFMEEMERRLVSRALRESDNNISEAARKLDTPYSTLQRRITDLGI